MPERHIVIVCNACRCKNWNTCRYKYRNTLWYRRPACIVMDKVWLKGSKLENLFSFLFCLRDVLALSMSAIQIQIQRQIQIQKQTQTNIEANANTNTETNTNIYLPERRISTVHVRLHLRHAFLKLLQDILQHLFHFWNISWKICPCNICFTGNYTSEMYPAIYPATYVSLGIALLKYILENISLQHMFHWELHFWNISWKIYPWENAHFLCSQFIFYLHVLVNFVPEPMVFLHHLRQGDIIKMRQKINYVSNVVSSNHILLWSEIRIVLHLIIDIHYIIVFDNDSMILWEHYTVQSWSNDHIQSGLKALIRGGGDSSWIEPAQKWFYWATDWWSRTKTLWRTTHTTTIWPVLYFQFSHHIIKYAWYLQIIYEAEPKRFHKADWQPSLGHLVRLTQGHCIELGE